MEINTDKRDRRIKAMKELCPYPNTVSAWVLWRMGFRHGGEGHPISPNGTLAYYEGYKAGDDWARAN